MARFATPFRINAEGLGSRVEEGKRREKAEGHGEPQVLANTTSTALQYARS